MQEKLHELAANLPSSKSLHAGNHYFGSTVGTKIIADPNRFQESMSEKTLIFIAGLALFGISYRFQKFSGFALVAGQITGISLKAINSSNF